MTPDERRESPWICKPASECDQRCKHCYLFSEDARMACKSMSWDDMMHVLDSCYDFCNRVGRQPYFYITGGDPILHRDFWRLAEELHARGAIWCIMGNPFHLTDEVCARMHALGCRKYQLSLDGATAATHDLFRKPGSFDETLRAAGCIKRSGMWLVLMSTVSSMNDAELPDMISLAARIGADVFAFGCYCPTKDQRLEEFHMEPLEYRRCCLLAKSASTS
ncbi:radical SAM protein [Senegalimassilia faecalis]|uniref:radical SAM protein n=1 Tax=Senegalimassilia faecalis TaxID=2509433 RepID=UPI003A973CA0